MSSQAYTPGLKISENYMIRKRRRLPIYGDVLVNEGDIVSPDTIVAKTKIAGDPHIVKVAEILRCDPQVDDIDEFMLKKVGESVKENELIARYEAFFGFLKRECVSPITGTLERISKFSGQAVIRELPISVEVNAYIPGSIVKVLPKEGVDIETLSTFIQGIFGIGGETHGDIMTLSETPKDVLESEQIGSDCAGKILVGGSMVTLDALTKAVKVGAKGIVAGGIRDEDLIKFLGYDVSVAITGEEECGLTMIITEGFGKMNMSEKTFDLLQKFEGKMACINGATQIRAGVIRPEIIIPHEIGSTNEKDKLERLESFHEEGLKVGTKIRLIRRPYFGMLGKVFDLPIELQQIDTESQVRILKAELGDGRVVIVPRANVEIIEE